MVRLYSVYIKTNVKVHESRKKMKEIDEREEREWEEGSLYYFIGLYVKIKTEMLRILLDELIK